MSSFFGKIKDSINDQVWFQDLKNKWDELDQQSKTYATIGISALLAIIFFYILISSITSVYSTRAKYQKKSELIALLKDANQQINSYRSTNLGSSDSKSSELQPYFTQSANRYGITNAAISISKPTPGTQTDASEESLYEISLTSTNIRKAMQYAVALETGNIPVRIRRLKISTESPEGFIDAKLFVSAFSLKEEE